MKAISFTSSLRINPIMIGIVDPNPIAKRTIQDVDFTPKPVPVRLKAKRKVSFEISAPRLFNFFK